MAEEVFPWLKSLPLAPEYHPTVTEFQDPIAYILKIEKEASEYGICKIVPPVPASPKKTIITNLNHSLSAQNPDSSPTFTTSRQQIGFCPRKNRKPIQKPVWQSGETYTLPQFETKAKTFEKNYFKKGPNSKKISNPLEVETLYWKSQVGKPFLIEYANDIPGSAFHQTVGGHSENKQRKREIGDYGLTVGETEWNMRRVSRAKGSLLKFVKEEIAGVTSPMVYMGMLFSWFAWHVEDHDLHSLNYMHMGCGKTWYGVPKDAAGAFEDVIKDHGYGGEVNPIVTFAALADKTTIMSPDILLKAGVPCCRLVQNAGEFVVTFPRAYHSGFSHGFNCAEAANIATPEWLRVARDAAIRRASINFPPLVSHSELLYDLIASLSTSVPTSIKTEPRSSRLKDKITAEGEFLVKRLFLHDMMQNNEFLHTLGKGSPIVLFSKDSCFGSQFNASSSMLSHISRIQNDEMKSLDRRAKRRMHSSFGGSRDEKALYSLTSNDERNKTSNSGLFSCVRCGILCYACVAIVQPTEATARYLTSVDCSDIIDLDTTTDIFTTNNDANFVDLKFSSVCKVREMSKSDDEGLFDVPIRMVDQIQVVDDHTNTISAIGSPKVSTSLDLLALTYGDHSDYSEEENDVEKDKSSRSKCNKFFMESNRSMGQFQYEIRVPHPEIKPLSNANQSEPLIIGNAITPCDEDTSRMHVFCLQHAAEVEQCLQKIGGVHMLLLCHQDYPNLEAEARLVEKEFETDHVWTDLEFKETSKQDKELIHSALDKQQATHGNHDWSVRLGLNLFYTSRLSRSPLYSKQMPYHSVIYKAFGNDNSPSNKDLIKSKQSGKHKKIIMAGKWCGKVWMSNHVHPLLVARDVEDQENEITDVFDFAKMDVKIEKNPKITLVVAKSLRKRKRKNVTISKPMKFSIVQSLPPPLPLSPSPPPLGNLPLRGGFRRQRTKIVRTKKGIESKEGEFGCDIVGCNMSFDSRQDLMAHKENVCLVNGCEKRFVSHKYLMQHRRVHMEDRPLKCPWEDCQVTFKWAWARTEHIRVHTGERPYTCAIEGCGRTFRFVSDFSRHKRNTRHFAN